jgi:hypothetical protein
MKCWSGLVALVATLLVAQPGWARRTQAHGDCQVQAPFEACPSCTVPFNEQWLSVEFRSSSLTLEAAVRTLQNTPGAPSRSLHVLCGSAVLKRGPDAAEEAYTIEMAGPAPTLSRSFYERCVVRAVNHPTN